MRAARIAVAAVLGLLVAWSIGVEVHADRQHSTFTRYTSTYGRCLTGTAWDSHTWAGASQQLSTPARLTVYGSDGSGQLAFTARTAVGSDRIRPADPFTVEVLRQHQCPTD